MNRGNSVAPTRRGGNAHALDAQAVIRKQILKSQGVGIKARITPRRPRGGRPAHDHRLELSARRARSISNRATILIRRAAPPARPAGADRLLGAHAGQSRGGERHARRRRTRRSSRSSASPPPRPAPDRWPPPSPPPRPASPPVTTKSRDRPAALRLRGADPRSTAPCGGWWSAAPITFIAVERDSRCRATEVRSSWRMPGPGSYSVDLSDPSPTFRSTTPATS